MDRRGGGWVVFAAIVLGMAGVMRFFDAIWAFGYHGALPSNLEGAVFGHSLKTYGWVYLIVAVVMIGASFGVLIGSQFSRWVGIVAGAGLHQLHLVDAVLPDLVADLHWLGVARDLRARRVRR